MKGGMSRSLRVHHLAESEELGLLAGSNDPEVLVLNLSTAGVPGRRGFFGAVRSMVLLDPPVSTERSWDALEDSLWEGLFQLPERRIVIYWHDASDFRVHSPAEYEVAISVLESVVDALADRLATAGSPKDVEVYIG